MLGPQVLVYGDHNKQIISGSKATHKYSAVVVIVIYFTASIVSEFKLVVIFTKYRLHHFIFL